MYINKTKNLNFVNMSNRDQFRDPVTGQFARVPVTPAPTIVSRLVPPPTPGQARFRATPLSNVFREIVEEKEEKALPRAARNLLNALNEAEEFQEGQDHLPDFDYPLPPPSPPRPPLAYPVGQFGPLPPLPPPPPGPPPPGGNLPGPAPPAGRHPLWDVYDRVQSVAPYVRAAGTAYGVYRGVRNAQRSYAEVARRGEFAHDVRMAVARGEMTGQEARRVIGDYDRGLALSAGARWLPAAALAGAFESPTGFFAAAPDQVEALFEGGRYLGNKLHLYDPSAPSSAERQEGFEQVRERFRPTVSGGAITAPATIEAYHVPKRRCRGRKCKRN